MLGRISMSLSSILRAGSLLSLASLLASCGSTFTESGAKDLLDPSQLRDAAPVVNIAASGVTPTISHVSPGVPIRFVNSDSVPHKLAAAPELGYGDCPEMATLGVLAAGQSGSVTLDRALVICGFHDEAGPTNRAFQGLLVAH
jgi:plastocyanin